MSTSTGPSCGRRWPSAWAPCPRPSTPTRSSTCASARRPRWTIALINDCVVCQDTRATHAAEHDIDDGFYAEVAGWAASPVLTERERLAAEFAQRFALDHQAMDDELWARLRGGVRRRRAGRPHHVLRDVAGPRPGAGRHRRAGARRAHPRLGHRRSSGPDRVRSSGTRRASRPWPRARCPSWRPALPRSAGPVRWCRGAAGRGTSGWCSRSWSTTATVTWSRPPRSSARRASPRGGPRSSRSR